MSYMSAAQTINSNAPTNGTQLSYDAKPPTDPVQSHPSRLPDSNAGEPSTQKGQSQPDQDRKTGTDHPANLAFLHPGIDQEKDWASTKNEHLDEVDIRSVAFFEASSKRTLEEIAKLRDIANLRDLFSKLNERDVAHRGESLFRKGIKRIAPFVKGVDQIVNIANPVTNFKPAAAPALAVVKSIMTVSLFPERAWSLYACTDNQ
jgi:hypothetical protein